jgi:hypothetical protein
MHVQQVFSTIDTVYNQERKRVYKTVVDNTGKTSVECQEYYYPLYTKKGVLEVPKGATIDLKA